MLQTCSIILIIRAPCTLQVLDSSIVATLNILLKLLLLPLHLLARILEALSKSL